MLRSFFNGLNKLFTRFFRKCLRLISRKTHLELNLEPIPVPCWDSGLESLLSKDQWDQLQTRTYIEAKYCCQICDEEASKCHVRWYYDDVTKTQILEGLIALCSKCHCVKHMVHPYIKGKGYETIEHLRKINKMSFQEAEKYVEECFALWNFRNSFNWKVDLSWLHTKGLIPKKITREYMYFRSEPQRRNYVLSSEKYLKAGLSQPKEVWPSILEFCKKGSAAAIEIILSLPRELSTEPVAAQDMVLKFVAKYFIVDDLFAQINIILPNPCVDSLDDDLKCLGLSHAHVLISLLPIRWRGKRFSPMSKSCLALLKSLCSQTYPHSPGQYSYQNTFITRWLTKQDLELVWKQNAGFFAGYLCNSGYFFSEMKQHTCSDYNLKVDPLIPDF
jgi:hypothetical protein